MKSRMEIKEHACRRGMEEWGSEKRKEEERRGEERAGKRSESRDRTLVEYIELGHTVHEITSPNFLCILSGF